MSTALAQEPDDRGAGGLVWEGVVYLSLVETCQRYGLSRYRLRKLMKQHGLGRYRRYGDNRRYLRQRDVDAVRDASGGR